MVNISIEPQGIFRWVSFDASPLDAATASARCTPAALKKAIGHLGDLEIVRAGINRTGQYTVEPPAYMAAFPGPAPPQVVTDLPDFCEVIVGLKTPGGHVNTITVWMPLAWNERFLGTTGGGNRTAGLFMEAPAMRVLSMPVALRNGFATASTDGANTSVRFADWGLDEKTGEIDWDLTDQWVHRATHDMTLIGKAVTEAIHGRPPKFSYLSGTSGGGRQALVEAQRYPNDYDGIWSGNPGINWTKLVAGALWPSLVLKEISMLPVAKLEAFQAAAVEACDGVDGLRDGVIGAFDPRDFQASALIGTSTAAGEITVADAQAMQMIWDGPRTRNGVFLWHGLGAGTESWGVPGDSVRAGVCVTHEVNGKLEHTPFYIGPAFARAWLLKDLNWDWKTLTFEQFESLFEQCVREFAAVASDDPDLRPFRASGGKIIITHGSDDQVVSHMGTVDYYRRVIDMIGSEGDTREFARMFISEGDAHSMCRPDGPGPTISGAMAALMNWVEKEQAPDELLGQGLTRTGELKMTRPIYAYPMAPTYRGAGDPNDAASFRPVHFSKRAAGVRG